jgi:hypothetical protein
MFLAPGALEHAARRQAPDRVPPPQTPLWARHGRQDPTSATRRAQEHRAALHRRFPPFRACHAFTVVAPATQFRRRCTGRARRRCPTADATTHSSRVVTLPSRHTRLYIYQARSSPAMRVTLLPRAAQRRHGRLCRAPVLAYVPGCTTFQAPPLGSVGTPADTTCPGRVVPLSGIQLLRPPSRGSAVPPSPAPPNPDSGHQSVTAG